MRIFKAPGASRTMKSKKNEKKVTLACVECSERNYSTPKSQSQATERLELKKYCPRCGAHTIHRETR
jgi:large subunit ribosomal protein L33